MARVANRTRLLGTVVAAVVLLPLTAGTSAATPSSGLHGFVRKGPITPVCYEDVPCDGPAAGVVLTFVRADGTRAQVKTRATGFYRIKLPAGRYTVKASQGHPPLPYPQKVRVRVGHDDRLDFYIYTGIQ
jgi:hypothetical protein